MLSKILSYGRISNRRYLKTWTERTLRNIHKQERAIPEEELTFIQRTLRFFQTENGKKATNSVVQFCILSSIAVFAAEDSYLKPYLLNFYETEERPVSERGLGQYLLQDRRTEFSEHILDLYNQVLDDLKIFKGFRHKMDIYRSDTTTPVGFGVIGANIGMFHIGYPSFADWRTVDDVDWSQIRIKTFYNVLSRCGLKVEKKDEDKLNTDDFVYSDKAKKFMLAQAVSEGNSNHFFFKTMIPPLLSTLAYMICRSTNVKLNLFKHPLKIRLALYSFVSAGFIAILFGLFAIRRAELDRSIDNELCSLSEDYRLGGIEYYEKTRKIHLYLRDHVRFGDYYFDENGDLYGSWYEPMKSRFSTMKGRAEFCRTFNN